MKDNKLQVNDVVYDYYEYKKGISMRIIDRVTKTMAFSGRVRYNRNVVNGEVYFVGGNSGGRVNDEKMKNEFYIQTLVSKIRDRFILESLPKKTLEMIVNIMYSNMHSN